MYKFLTKYGQLLAVGVSVVVVAIFLITSFVGLSNAGYTTSTDLIDYTKEISFFNTGLYLTIALLVIAALAWILFALYQLISNPKESIKFLFGGLAIVIVFVIFYFVANTEVSGKMAELVSKFNITEGVNRLITAGLNTTAILAGLSILVMLVSEFVNIFK
jgi:F0F1-type ATP synthase assembly protein I